MSNYKKILLKRWEESNKQLVLQKELERITNELNIDTIKKKKKKKLKIIRTLP